MSYFGFREYVPVATRRANAAKEMAKLRKSGRLVSPVVLDGRLIARNFWGKSWCDNLERYSDFANRLPRGRTYVRNGSVVDLQIERGKVRAIVSGSELYTVEITIGTLAKPGWAAICRDCLGSVGSLVELLQGKLSKNVMERVCREGDGLFPHPREIKMSCSCPDGAVMCKHVSAVLYGVGARLDAEPDVLFALRGVDRSELIGSGSELPMTSAPIASGRVVADDDIAALFGIEIDSTPSAIPVKDAKAKSPAGKAAKEKLAASTARGAKAGAAKTPAKSAKPAVAASEKRPAAKTRAAPTKVTPAPVATKRAKSPNPVLEPVARPSTSPRLRREPTLAAKWKQWKKPKAR